MLFGHQNQPHVRTTRFELIVCLILVLAGVGYAIWTQIEDARSGANLIGVSSAGAVQQKTTPPAVEYFPAGYVNQAKEVEEPIATF